MRLVSAVLVLALLLGGCTYSFRGQSAGAIKSIAIPTFENLSAEFGIADQVTQALVRGFQRDGTLRVTTESQADAILRGRIVRVEDQPYTARANQTVEEYRFAMSCEIELINTATQTTLWTQVYPAWAIYTYTGSLENRSAAIEEAVGKLQQDLLNKIVGSW
jgi:outer membrane lipopolysaccharide assembly protein LptE/RlpB